MSIGAMSRRSVGLVVAVLLAAFATAAWMSYVRSVERRALTGSANVTVWLAKEAIPAGTSADFAVQRNLLQQQQVPRRILADGAVTNLQDLRGTVASVTILKGEQILRARFVSPQQAGRLLAIPADHQAMAVKVESPPGVAGFVQPRDHVNVIAKVRKQQGDQVRFLMQDVEVLAVGRITTVTVPAAGARDATRKEADPQTQQVFQPVTMTLSVTAAQSE
ncbi:MAG: hypothetical protein NVSMB57_09550 [Actinomycetota bacterium]